MKLDIGGYSDRGNQRSSNEDAYDIQLAQPDRVEQLGVLFAVADGMGGHLAGEIASKIAIQTLMSEYEHSTDEDPGSALLAAVYAANQAVWSEGQSDGTRHGMGTTLVAAVVRSGLLIVAHVGDSPAFMVREGKVQRLTQDHSWVADAVARGHLKTEEAETHPYRHVLTRALGSLPEVEVDLRSETSLQPGDTLVLCSDGLVRHVKESELPEIVQGQSADAAAKALVDLANQRGGEDNTTVVVCRILADS